MNQGREVLELPLAELMAAAAAKRDARFRHPGDLLAEGVHPAHDVVPRPVWVLHLRQGARPSERALSSPSTKCSRSRAAARSWVVTKRSSRWARGPRSAIRRPRRGSRKTATRRRSTTSSAAARLVLEETGLLPHANAGALAQPDLEQLRAVSPSQGMMIETLAARLGEPGGPHYGAPDKTPERRLATLEGAGRARVPFTHRHPRSASARRARNASTHSSRSPTRTAVTAKYRKSSSELPAEAGHVDAPSGRVPGPRSCSGRSRRLACCSPPTCTSRPRRT